MCDKELLVSYLYDELDAPSRKAVLQHLASCRECREESQRLRGLRTQLGSWTVSDAPLNLRIGPPAAAPRGFRLSGVWGLAAAAALLLATAAVAGVEIRTIEGGLAIRSPWAGAQSQPAAQAASRAEVDVLQERIRSLETALTAVQTTPAPVVTPASVPAAGGGVNDVEIMRRVMRLIRESEDRQQQVLATRLVQGFRELQAAHSTDLTRLERALNQQQGVWTDEMLRNREEIRQMYRLVSQQQTQR